MKRVKKAFKESWALIGESYKLAMKNKKFWFIVILLGMLPPLAVAPLAVLLKVKIAWHQSFFNAPLALAGMEAGFLFLLAAVTILLYIALIYVAFLAAFLYAAGLRDKKRVAVGACLKKAFASFGKPFFWAVVLLSFVPFMPAFFVLAVPIFAYGSGRVGKGFADLVQLWKHFWSKVLIVVMSYMFFVFWLILLVWLPLNFIATRILLAQGKFALVPFARMWSLVISYIILIPVMLAMYAMAFFVLALIHKKSTKIRPKLYK